MFHRTPCRIVAHVRRCVLALMIRRTAGIAAEGPWSRLTDVLERLEAVRDTAEGETTIEIPGLRGLLLQLGRCEGSAPKRGRERPRGAGRRRWGTGLLRRR
jgi:hypothetical protein